VRVRWLATARRDLREAVRYIARDDPQAALRVLAAIEERTGLLAEHPQLGRAGRLAGSRELVVAGTPFIVVYRVRKTVVQVVRVLHGARRWPRRL
jgi:toxin ParE1/3/4